MSTSKRTDLDEARDALGLPDTATDVEIEIAQADSIGDTERAAELRAGLEPSPAADPTHPGDRDDASQNAAAQITYPIGVLAIGETRGHYVVLWAAVPPDWPAPAVEHADGTIEVEMVQTSGLTRPDYREVDVVAATDPEHAKRIVCADIAVEGYDASYAPFLRERASERGGVLLRAIPARSWPATVEATTNEPGPPILRVR